MPGKIDGEMINQRRFAPIGGRFRSESVARFIGICNFLKNPNITGINSFLNLISS
ncbi:MAG: hypothetical protein AB1410_03270 [Acidobacteriota bacterium]